MKATRFLILAAAMLLLNAAPSAAQVVTQTKPDVTQQATPSSNDQDDDDLIQAVFDPITADLNLTASQKVRILTIITEAMAKSDPLFEQLDELDGQVSVAAFTGQLDEMKIKDLSAKEAALLNEIIAIKARAKTSFYRVLTDEQRAMVIEQFRMRSVQNLGSISN